MVVAAGVLPASAWPAAVVRVLQIRILVRGSVRVVGCVERCWVCELQVRERATCEDEDRNLSQRRHDVIGKSRVDLAAVMIGCRMCESDSG